jgi:hypothetical protein
MVCVQICSHSATHQRLLLFTILGEGRACLVYTKGSVAPLSTVKRNGFGTFVSDLAQIASRSLLGTLAPDYLQIPSRLLPNCFQIASRLFISH